MRSIDSTIDNENQDVHLSDKCTNQPIETVGNTSSQNVFSSKKKSDLRFRVAYDNIYSKKPIFRRKLIEKYSTARYNFNTKCIYSVQTISKKKYGEFKRSSGRSNSINTRHGITCAVGVKNSKLPIQSPVDAEKSFLNNRHDDTTINSVNCEVTKRGESSVSTHDEKDANAGAKLNPSQLTSDCFKKEKTSKNASSHPDNESSFSVDVRCGVPKSESTLPARSNKSAKNGIVGSNLRASILSKANLSETLEDSRSSKNLETAGSAFSDCEDSDSGESTYLTISFDGDSDSRFSLISDEYSEKSFDFKESENAQKADTGDVDASTAKQPDTDSCVTVENAESRLMLKRSDTNSAGLKLSDSDSDSGLQLGSSDGEKSCSDHLQSGNRNVELTQLLKENVEKSQKHLLSFETTNDWVKNSSQSTGQSKLDSRLDIETSSAQNIPVDGVGEHQSSDSNTVYPNVSGNADSKLTIAASSSLDGDKKVKSSVVQDLGATCSKPIMGSKNQKFDASNQEQLTEKVTESLNCKRPEELSCEKTNDQSNVCDENNGEARNTKYMKSVEKWKLVPSTIYQYLAERFEMQKKETELPAMPKKKRKKGTWSARKSLPAKKVPEEPVGIPLQDPYIDISKEFEIKEEATDELPVENIGMILHVGVKRPLFPEIYRNIIALNEKTDGQITDLWANFALTTLITDKSSKRFKSIFLPVVDTKLKSTIAEYQQKTGCQFQELDLQKVTMRVSPEEISAAGPSSENVCTRKRKNADVSSKRNRKVLSPEIVQSPSKKRKTEASTKLSTPKVDLPTAPISAPDTSPDTYDMSCINHDEESKPVVEDPCLDIKGWKTTDEYSMSTTTYSEPTDEKVSDETLLAQHGYKPCWVLLPKVPVPCKNTCVEEEEEGENEHHFFGVDHCSRTFGQMFDYRSRNLSLVFFHRVKRILRLQRQNNKLFHSCQYVRLQSDISEELEEVDVLDDCPDTMTESEPFPVEVTNNPLDILKMWKLNIFEAPLLKGIDANASKFPIRFMNHQLLKSESDAKWFILQLSKCVLNVFHQNKDDLPIELLFQIICRADLTKKIVCHTIGMEFDPDVLNFGVYGVPGLCEAVLVGPYENGKTHHDLTATVQLWDGETARIPISETSFDTNLFFLWNEETKLRSVYGLWWKPGDAVPCTSDTNSAFMNHLFYPSESVSNIEHYLKVQSLLRQHPCLTYSKFERAGHDLNIRLIHQAPRLNYTATGLKVSERVALDNPIVDDSPLLQPTKLRSRTNMPNYCDMASPKIRLSIEPRSDFKREPRMQAPRGVSIRSLSISERLRINTVNERLRRKEFAILRTRLRSTIGASEDAPLISILNKAQETVKNLVKNENVFKRNKRGLFYKRKKLLNRLRADMRQFPSDHSSYRNSMELISKLSKCDRAESFGRSGLTQLSDDSNYSVINTSVNSDEEKPIESRKEPSPIESSKQKSVTELRKPPIIRSNEPPSRTQSSEQHSVAESSPQLPTKEPNSDTGANRSALKRSRRVNKCLWRKVIESRFEPSQPRQQPQQQPRQQPHQQPRQQPHQKPRQQSHQQTRQQPHQQPRQQPKQQPRQQPHHQTRQQPQQTRQQPRPPVSESPEICSPSDVSARTEHSYAKRGIGLRSNSRWASNGIPRKEYKKLMSTPSSLMVDCDQPATDSSSERDQVAVYLTENDLPITKLIIQRLKSVNENSRHLTPTERRNQIIALIRKIVSETLTGARSQASNQDERVLLPRLRLLQRLLEGANIQIRDSSKIRVIDETIEISDDDDQDEFSIESMGNLSDADNSDDQMSMRRVYVKVSSANSTQSNSSPLRNGITLTTTRLISSSPDEIEEPVNDAATIIDEQLSVENQVILNSNGDQVDFSTYIDNTPSLKPSRRHRGPLNAAKRKLTVIKRVNGGAPTDDEADDVEPLPKSPVSECADVGQKLNRSKTSRNVNRTADGSSLRAGQPPNRSTNGRSKRGTRGVSSQGTSRSKPSTAGTSSPGNQSSNQSTHSASSVKNLSSNRNNVHINNPKKTQNPENLVPNSEVKLLRDLLLAPDAPAAPKARLYAKKTFSSPNYRKLIAQRRAMREVSSDISADESLEEDCESNPNGVSDESSLSINDYMHLYPDLLEKSISPKKSSVSKFKPNILKNSKAKSSSKKVSLPPEQDELITAKERLRCPSFMPPSVGSTLPSETVVPKEEPIEMEESAVDENMVSPLGENADTVDDGESYDENGSTNGESSTSRRSSIDSSTRLAIKSFASVHSFNDNFINNMDRMLKF